MHPAAVLLIWLITVALALMGINLSLFKKPQAQLKKDIEFVLVDKEAKPRDPNTRNRADMNSRSGGINDPKRKVSMPSPAPSKPAKPSAAAKSANKIIKQQQKQIAQQAKAPAKKPAQQTPAPKKSTQQQAAQNKPSPAKPAPPTARPSSRPISAPAPTPKPSSSFTVPAPKGASVGKTLSTGPVGGTSAPAGSKSGAASSGGGSKVVHMRQDLRFLLLQAAEADNWQEVLMAPVMLVTLVEAEELLVLMLLENLTLDLI